MIRHEANTALAPAITNDRLPMDAIASNKSYFIIKKYKVVAIAADITVFRGEIIA